MMGKSHVLISKTFPKNFETKDYWKGTAIWREVKKDSEAKKKKKSNIKLKAQRGIHFSRALRLVSNMSNILST